MMVHNNNLIKSTLVAAVGALLTSFPAFSASIVNGDFEQSAFVSPSIEGFGFPATPGFAYLGTNNTAITGFTVIPSAGNVNGGATYLGNQIFNNDGALSRTVQLNGQSARGGISTLVSGLTQNQVLDVSFDLSGNTNQGEVDLGTAVIPLITVSLQNGTSQDLGFTALPAFSPGVGGAALNLDFIRFTASLVYSGSASTATLSFQSRSGTGLGPIIDNIAVANGTTPIPFAGFIIGGVLFGASKLVKLRKSAA
jgi:hypothetical protein